MYGRHLRADLVPARVRWIAGALAALLALAALSGEAEAHSLLRGADPPPESRLPAPPDRVTAWFTEPLEPAVSRLQVFDGRGVRADDGRSALAEEDRTAMSVGLREGLAPGFYTVTWETLSQLDGHIRFGTFRFVVLQPDGGLPPDPGFAAGQDPQGARATGAAAKAFLLSAAVALIGGIGFFLLVSNPAAQALDPTLRPHAVERATTLLFLVAWPALLALALAGSLELAAQVQQAGGWDRLQALLGSAWWERWLWRQGLVVLVALGLALARRAHAQLRVASSWSAFGAGITYLWLISASSHGAALATGSAWAALADFVHFTAAAAWVGGLVQLGLFLVWNARRTPLERRHDLLAATLQRFSLLAATGLVALLATGVFSAFAQVPNWDAILTTGYGRWLAAKVALVIPLLAVAAVNALALRPAVFERLRAGQSLTATHRWLSRAVTAESALALVVVLLAGVLSQVTPARAEVEATTSVRAQSGAVPFDQVTQSAQGIDVRLEVTPNVVGTNTFRVTFEPREERGEVSAVRLRLRPLEGGDEAEAEAVRQADDAYVARGDFLETGGAWLVRIDAERERMDDVRVAFQVGPQGVVGRVAAGSLGYPLVAGDWWTVAAGALLVGGVLVWVWAPHVLRVAHVTRVRWAAGGPLALAAVAALTASLTAQSAEPVFDPPIALRYEADDERQILLAVAPFQPGENRVEVSMFGASGEPLRVGETVRLRLSRLEREGRPEEVLARFDRTSRSYAAHVSLESPGWWSIEVLPPDGESMSFYIRLDDPSLAPNAFAPATHDADPRAEALYRSVAERYDSLSSVRWIEQLTGGSLAPSGIGGLVISEGTALRPDRLHFAIIGGDSGPFEVYRGDGKLCRRSGERPWSCEDAVSLELFDLSEYQGDAAAFTLGRSEVVDGRSARLLLFYNPRHEAWYAWWVDEETNDLIRQVMVAPGHIMLTRYLDHNAPLTIRAPEAASPG